MLHRMQSYFGGSVRDDIVSLLGRRPCNVCMSDRVVLPDLLRCLEWYQDTTPNILLLEIIDQGVRWACARRPKI